MNSDWPGKLRNRTTTEITAKRFGPRAARRVGVFFVALAIVAPGCTVRAQGAATVFSGPTNAVAAGDRASIWLTYLNDSEVEARRSFPERIGGQMLLEQRTNKVELELRRRSEAGDVVIPPGGFARREYRLPLSDLLAGQVRIEIRLEGVHRVALEVRQPEAPTLKPMNHEEEAGRIRADDPVPFFQAHFFPHEPFYFIAGTESPNAKFQISFKYQLLTGEGRIAKRVPWVTNFFLGYTQTSLWDWNEPSAPFFDSSYRPELLYWGPEVDQGQWAEWFRLDLQAGVQHESNGRDGLSSRSLNIVYFKPSFVFGKPGKLQLTLSPRTWVYIGDVEDNPDIKDYRGYVELHAVVGWARHVQLAALTRV
ncbi:MAG TPA: phospholipase A, partial [Verrucomicrobiae bacterium]|nr:phospholipase A [Verrucomicrobiae bacterium]